MTGAPRAVELTDLPLPLAESLVPAGFPSPADDFLEGPIDIGNFLVDRPAATYVLRVSGDSMKGAGIFDGDFIVVDRSITPKANHIVVALINGEFTVKRLKLYNSTLWLAAANKKYPDIAFSESSPVEVWGVVTGSFRRFSERQLCLDI